MAIHTLAYTYFDIPSSQAFPEGRKAPRPVVKLTLPRLAHAQNTNSPQEAVVAPNENLVVETVLFIQQFLLN